MEIARRRSLNALLEVARVCFDLDPYMPVSTLLVLLEIARKDGRSHSEIAEATGLSLPTLSRQIGLLSDYSSSGKDSFGFIEASYLPENRRMKAISLTSSGRAFVKKLLDQLD
jgi:DNA-binding MarR family transcriptional regulator